MEPIEIAERNLSGEAARAKQNYEVEAQRITEREGVDHARYIGELNSLKTSTQEFMRQRAFMPPRDAQSRANQLEHAHANWEGDVRRQPLSTKIFATTWHNGSVPTKDASLRTAGGFRTSGSPPSTASRE